MIRFKTIKWKNFLSTGNQWTEIDFEKSNTTLIIGSNGAGKSTVLDALTFSLFNKPFRKINKGQLINTTNEKDCSVEVEFDVGTRAYKIVRGIKPAVFEIWVDGVMMNQDAAVIDQQKYLENNILKLNYKSFTQIVVLGSSSFVPFMQLSGTNRREVIEDLLDIRIFSSMNYVVKDKIRKVRESIKVLELKKESLSDKVEMQKDFMEELESRGNDNIKAKNDNIKVLTIEVDTQLEMNQILQGNIDDVIKEQEKVTGSPNKLKKLNNLKGKITQKVSTITKEHKFFKENVTCPTCTQDIEEDFRVNRIADVQTKEKDLIEGF